MKLAAIIIPYFGVWPEWFELYLYSLGKNPLLTVIFFTDIPLKKSIHLPHNAKFINISFKDYCKNASEKLGIEFCPEHSFKLCDLRPFYPIIHKEELKGYKYIGWGDIDLVYGDLNKFIFNLFKHKYQIISTHSHIFSGHFTLIKNDPSVYEKIKNINNWENFLTSKKNEILDERGLAYFLTPKLNYIRFIFDKSGGFRGEFKRWTVFLMQLSAKLLYPEYHLREMFTTVKTKEYHYYTYQNGIVKNYMGKELPYVHFYFFKKPNYKTQRTDFWKGNFYQIEEINDEVNIIISKDGIKSR